MKIRIFGRLSHINLLVIFLLSFISCETSETLKAAIVPLPKELTVEKGNFMIDATTKIAISDNALTPLGELLNEQLRKYNHNELEMVGQGGSGRSITFTLDSTMADEAYRLEVSDNITLTAQNYSGLSSALASLVQLIQLQDSELVVPKVTISDSPDFGYRAVMLDVARFWHPVQTLKETIDLMWRYKVKYLALHLADNRHFTFPLEGFPKLQGVQEDGTPFHYTKEQLTDLVEYAKHRGIAIIPEIDLPGHSQQLWSLYPEVFGSVNQGSGEAEQLYVVNMAKEETYSACAAIIEQLAEVFYTSPYINVGGDEVYLEEVKNVPEYKAYCKANNLNAALEGNADELFCHFLNRMHEVVKKTGKKTIMWEGFPDSGAGDVTISKEVTVIAWNTTYNHPENLLSNGYNIINSTWIPWYVVGAMNLAAVPEKGYNWDVTHWSHWKDDLPDVRLESKEGIKGGQISFWEQTYYQVVPILRERVPVLAERLWNNSAAPDFENFNERFKSADASYQALCNSVVVAADGLVQQQDLTFVDSISVTLSAPTGGQIRYAFSENWGIPDMNVAAVYKNAVQLNTSGILTVQTYDSSGNAIGFPQQQYYQKIEPVYTYKVYGPAPNKGWKTLPDTDTLQLVREGVSGKMNSKRVAKINGELFAKVKPEGHIETRFNGLYNQYALTLEGKINIEAKEKYQFRLQTHDGLAALYIDGKLIAKGSQFKNEFEEFETELSEGSHTIQIRYYYKEIQNQLNLLYKTSDMEAFAPFENLVQPIK